MQKPFPITVKVFVLLFLAAMSSAPLFGQDSPASPKPSASPVDITPEQRVKLRVAYQKAEQDPAVLAAQKTMGDVAENYRTVVDKTILAQDPGMKPIMDKGDIVDQSKLITPEIEKLRAAFQKASKDPAVVDAAAKVKEAKKALNSATRAAILQADASLAPVLDEIDRSRQQAGIQ